MKRDIEQRTFEFALHTIALCRTIPYSRDKGVLSQQLLKSGTSIGANVEEAEAGSTKAEFAHKMNIALREARESHYWLRLIKGSNISASEGLDGLLDEAGQLKRILGAIVSSSRGVSKRRAPDTADLEEMES